MTFATAESTVFGKTPASKRQPSVAKCHFKLDVS